jgi:hypothetical protein
MMAGEQITILEEAPVVGGSLHCLEDLLFTVEHSIPASK